MWIEAVATGDELRFGEIIDTNSAHIAQALGAEGLEIARSTIVGDAREEIVDAIRSALARADVVFVTGGLGPTEDDLTREALADVMGVELEFRPEAVEAIEKRIGRPVSGKNARQTRAPKGARLVPNEHGTAPGLRADIEGKTVYVMPGVPYEMERMLADTVLPEMLSERLSGTGASARRYFVVHGVPESQLATKLDGIGRDRLTIGTRVRYGTILVRATARCATRDESERLLDETSVVVRDRLGDAICGEGDHSLAYFAARAAIERGVKIAVAESCTGGLVSSQLVSVPGVSEVLVEAVVAYANEAKTRALGVDEALLREHGAVSPEVARAMADGVRRNAGADVAVSTTGIAGPTGGSLEKPVGLVYVGVSTAHGSEAVEKRLRGSREVVMQRSAEAALRLLLREIMRRPAG
jgi:nicotinamide-nucleotide amidase